MGGRRGDGQISLPDESQPEFHGQGTRQFGPAFVFELSLYLLDVYLLKEFIKIYENWSIFADGSRACPHCG